VVRRVFVPAAAAIFLAAAILAAAEPGSESLPVEDGAGLALEAAPGLRALARFSGEGLDREAWSRSLESALLRSGALDSIRRSQSEGTVSEEAARLGLDLAVSVEASRTEAPLPLSLAWAIYAAAEAVPLAEGRLELEAEPELRSLGATWDELVLALEAAARGRGPSGMASLSISGAPGTRIRIGKIATARLPKGGELLLELPAPASYRWRASHRGSLPERGILGLGPEGGRIELSPEPLRPWRLETGLLVAAYPDFWASWRFSEERFYLRAGLSQYLLGLHLADEDEGGSAFASSRLLQPGLGAGALFLEPDSPWRPYAGASLSFRLVFPPGASPYIDPVGPFSLGLHAGLEWKPLERWAFFFEGLGELYLFGDGELMAAARSGEGSSSSYGRAWFLDFPLMRFGARFSL